LTSSFRFHWVLCTILFSFSVLFSLSFLSCRFLCTYSSVSATSTYCLPLTTHTFSAGWRSHIDFLSLLHIRISASLHSFTFHLTFLSLTASFSFFLFVPHYRFLFILIFYFPRFSSLSAPLFLSPSFSSLSLHFHHCTGMHILRFLLRFLCISFRFFFSHFTFHWISPALSAFSAVPFSFCLELTHVSHFSAHLHSLSLFSLLCTPRSASACRSLSYSLSLSLPAFFLSTHLLSHLSLSFTLSGPLSFSGSHCTGSWVTFSLPTALVTFWVSCHSFSFLTFCSLLFPGLYSALWNTTHTTAFLPACSA